MQEGGSARLLGMDLFAFERFPGWRGRFLFLSGYRSGRFRELTGW
jgi:hypothetical protein